MNYTKAKLYFYRAMKAQSAVILYDKSSVFLSVCEVEVL